MRCSIRRIAIRQFGFLLGGVMFLPGYASADIVAGPIVNPANGHNYYVLGNAYWTDSEAEAVSLGGHLVTINDAAEDQWVADTFRDYGGVSRELWIGLNDAASEGTFVWSSGEPALYRNWAPGEPNNWLGIEDYGLLYLPSHNQPGLWNDARDVTMLNGVVEQIPAPGAALLAYIGLAMVALVAMYFSLQHHEPFEDRHQLSDSGGTPPASG